MAEFKAFMEEKLEGKAEGGEKGVESEWLLVAPLKLGGDRWLIADTDFIPEEDEGVVVEAPPGRYRMEAKAMTYGGDRRVSRVRVMLEGAKGELGEEVGETWVDTAGTGICDVATFKPAFDAIGEDDGLEKIREVAWEGPGGLIEFGGGAEMAYVRAGFGDGCYPVFALVENGKRVGFEIEFIEADDGYPFGEGGEEDEMEGLEGNPALSMLTELLGGFREKRTGDKESDRQSLKGIFDEVLEGLKATAASAVAEHRANMLEVRQRPYAMEMKFEKLPTRDWLERPEAQEMLRVLKEAGFSEVGCWSPVGQPQMKTAGFVRAQDRVTAGISANGDEYFFAWQVSFRDGTTFELTQTEKPKNPFPEWMRKEHQPGLAPGDFEREFKRLCPHGERVEETAETYVASMEQEFKRTNLWLLERGGLSKEELRAFVDELPEDEEEAEDVLIALRQEQAELMLFLWLKEQGPEFDPEEKSEDLYIVHGEMTPLMLGTEWWDATNDFETREPEFEGEDPLEAFARVNEEKGRPLKRVCRKGSGLRADYYLLAPEAP